MRVEVRPVTRLRAETPVDVPSVLAPVFTALAGSTVDLARLRVVCDWIQYRGNFRTAVDHRPVLAGGPPWPDAEPAGDATVEIAVDLRRCPDIDLSTAMKEALAEYTLPAGATSLPLEPWGAGRDGRVWRFNRLYWQALSAWEEASGQGYERALPGGRSDARNVEAAREMVRELFTVWDDLDSGGALPAELYVVEIGVGNGSQARTWLDAFAELDREHGRDYYRRLHYLMGDYSAHVLDRARQAVAHHGDHVNTLVLDATRPRDTLGFLSGNVFLVYLSNVYDNLPTDEVAAIDGRPYLVQTRAYLPDADVAAITGRYAIPRERLTEVVERLLRLGPDLLAEALPRHFADPGAAVGFWRDVWSALRRAERYVPLDDGYEIAPSLGGETLRPLLRAEGDVRMHVSNGAAGAFAETLPLLHPRGRLICHDLFVTGADQYRTGFYGPGKYDGSVVNWVNGPLLRLIGERLGFDVRITPFAQRPAANVKTLTAARAR